MSKLEKFDQKLELAVHNGLARIFGGKIEPKEVERALQREAEINKTHYPDGSTLAPNKYTIVVSHKDFNDYAEEYALNQKIFSRHLTTFIKERNWHLKGEVVVEFQPSPHLHTGQYRASGIVDVSVESEKFPPLTPNSGASPMTQNPGYENNRGPGYNSRPEFDHHAPEPHAYDQYADNNFNQPYDQSSYSPQPRGYGQQNYNQQNYDPNYVSAQNYPDQGYVESQGYAPELQGYAPEVQGYGQPNYGSPNSYNQPQGYAPEVQGYPQNYNQPSYEQPTYGQQNYEQPYNPQGNQQGYEPNNYGQNNFNPGQPTAYPPAAIILYLNDGSNRTYQLRNGSNILGRGQEAHFRLPDTGVSRRHAEIHWDGRSAIIADLNSTNGTTVNDVHISNWELANGDRVRVGHSDITVQFQ